MQPLPDMFNTGAYVADPMDTVQVAREQHLDIARLLIGALADIEHVDLSGSRPVDHALRARNQPLLQVLVNCGCRETAEVAAALQGEARLAGPRATAPFMSLAPGLLLNSFLQ